MPIYDLGQVVPDVKVTDTEGHLKPLSQQMGQKGLLIFVLRGTWCAFCVDQINTVQRNHHRYAEQGVESVFITPETADSVWSFRISQARPLKFGIHPDTKRETLELFISQTEIGILPATYLLDTRLRVVWRYIGKDEEDRPNHPAILEAVRAFLPPD